MEDMARRTRAFLDDHLRDSDPDESRSEALRLRMPDDVPRRFQEEVEDPKWWQYGQGEPWPNTALAREALEAAHEWTGAPWVAVLVGTAVATRLALTPINLLALRYVARLGGRVFMSASLLLESARREGRIAEGVSLLRAHFRREGFNPLVVASPVLVTLPVFTSFVVCNRHLIRGRREEYEAGGALWFADLTVPDPYYVLPLASVALTYASLQMSLSNQEHALDRLSRFRWLFVQYMRGLQGWLLVSLPLVSTLPAAVFCFWLPSAVWGVAYQSALRVRWVRRRLGLPELAAPPPPPGKDEAASAAATAAATRMPPMQRGGRRAEPARHNPYTGAFLRDDDKDKRPPRK